MCLKICWHYMCRLIAVCVNERADTTFLLKLHSVHVTHKVSTAALKTGKHSRWHCWISCCCSCSLCRVPQFICRWRIRRQKCNDLVLKRWIIWPWHMAGTLNGQTSWPGFMMSTTAWYGKINPLKPRNITFPVIVHIGEEVAECFGCSQDLECQEMKEASPCGDAKWRTRVFI